MGTIQELQLQIRGTELGSPKDTATDNSQPPQPPTPTARSWGLWIKAALYSSFILLGQTAGTLLGRFYYNNGGNSQWALTLVSSCGSPLLLVPLLLSPRAAPAPGSTRVRILAPIYILFGVMLTASNLMYSYGLLYLPVSTFSLICATQLAFNAVFSYFLNAQKFTFLIFNSVLLVSFSAVLLGVNSSSSSSSSSSSNGVSKSKMPLGFFLTLGASAIFSLILSLIQLTFQKVLKKETLSSVLQMQIWIGAVSTVISVVGLFASGDWRKLEGEMEGFEKGKVAYVMTLVWSAVCWQVSSVGVVGLTFAVSSLFSNMIATFVLPVIPIFAVVFFRDKMDGVYVVAMLIAVWGFCSYVYQDYLDYFKAKK